MIIRPTITPIAIADSLSGRENVQRQRSAARLVGSLGRTALPLLIELLTGPKPERTRQLAAHLLGDCGEQAEERLKRALALAGNVEQRVRILDSIDAITRDLHAELARGLADSNDEVHAAALRLAERLDDSRNVTLLAEHAVAAAPVRSRAAIRYLGRLGGADVVEPLLALLDSAIEPGRVVACCQALAQLGDPSTVESIVRVLGARGILSRRYRWETEARAAAADALSRIPSRQAAEALASFDLDPDPAVRAIAERASTE